MEIHYLEIVTHDVDASCETLSQLHGVVFCQGEAKLGNVRTAKLEIILPQVVIMHIYTMKLFLVTNSDTFLTSLTIIRVPTHVPGFLCRWAKIIV